MEPGQPPKKGLILGFFKNEDQDGYHIIPTAGLQIFDTNTNGELSELLKLVSGSMKTGRSSLFYTLSRSYFCVAVVNLGSDDVEINEQEALNERRENIRVGLGLACQQLKDLGVTSFEVDSCGDPEAAAEGCFLGSFTYDDLKSSRSLRDEVKIFLFDRTEMKLQKWKQGLIKAEGQNLARRLMETPANIMTPSNFAEITANLPISVRVHVRDRKWAEAEKMRSFLSVAKGSEEPPKFVEVHYTGASSSMKPIVLVGKGITFDSGGMCLKPASSMIAMRADMGGAACVVSAIYILAMLKEKVNVIGLTPLCENMVNGRANRPGDVVTAKNGKTIQIDNTDAEGRLILADALCYAHTFDPEAIIDVATLTGAMGVALGAGATGVFTNSEHLWKIMQNVSYNTGDRVWRMPLFRLYRQQIINAHLADLNNLGKNGREGGACTAAAFLKEFVEHPKWAHLDIAGVMETKDDTPYLRKGMSGRPTRTLAEFVVEYIKHTEDEQR
ncbi:LAP3 [Cordylochernes scorpioides]|uniref:Cytosol aminopeptidase n=1 Tax=Cordylochernes scorpioides TaxID=51811 RepID=A0ABY6K226_9ARAC|nr:LAP3 [Cordylochernes scorpioides]